MSSERFIEKEFTYAAERTTVRLITGFEDDSVAYHALEIIKWDTVPGAKGAVGHVEEWDSVAPTAQNKAYLAQRFASHVQSRI